MELVYKQHDGREKSLCKSDDVLWLKFLASEIHGEGELIVWKSADCIQPGDAEAVVYMALLSDGSYFSITGRE